MILQTTSLALIESPSGLERNEHLSVAQEASHPFVDGLSHPAEERYLPTWGTTRKGEAGSGPNLSCRFRVFDLVRM